MAVPYQITPINSTSGLFFKSLGIAKISNNKYSLLIFNNISNLENQEELISRYYTKSLGLCTTSARSNYHTNHCTEQLKILQTKLMKFRKNLDILTNHSRNKRGILNGVSYPIKWLFGIPDSDDAQFYSNSITELMSDQRQTHTLMQQQIHVITDTIRNFNQSVQSLRDNENSLNENILKFNKFSRDVTDHVVYDDIEIEILDHLLLLIELLNESLEISEQYLLSITLLRHGIIDYTIIEPKILMEELNLISQKFNLPLPLTFVNIEIYYQLIKIKAFFQDKILVIKLEIPIVNMVNDFEIFKVIPLPTPHTTNPQVLTYIEPSFPFILFSKSRTQFAMLKTLEKCKEYSALQWLCQSISTMKRRDQNSCELILFSQATKKIPSSCKIRTIQADIEVFQNTNPNEWIYVLSKPTDIAILCHSNEDYETTISKIGIITLSPNCKAYTDLTSLEPTATFSNYTVNIKIPVTDITMDDCCIKKGNNRTLESLQMKAVKLSNIDLNELNYAQHRLTQFDEILQEQLNKPFIIKYQNWFTSAIFFISSIVALLLGYKLLKWLNIIKILSKLLCFRKPSNPNNTNSCTNLFNQCLITTRDSSNVVNYQSNDNPINIPMELVTAPPPYNIGPRRSMRLSSETSTKSRKPLKEATFNME